MGSVPHVCFVSDTLHSYFGSDIKEGVGGAERQQYMISRKLASSNYDVSVLTLKYPGAPELSYQDGINVWNVIPDRRGLINAPIKMLSLFRYLHRLDADLYYVRGNDFLCIVTSLYCQFNNSAFVYAVANDANVEPNHLRDKSSPIRWAFLRAVDKADAVTTLTPHQRDVLESEYEIDATVIPCGYELPSESEVYSHDEREFVLWVGRLDREQKQPEIFLDLACELPNISFVMIGTPDNDDHGREYFELVRNRAHSIENLTFIEFVPPEEIHEYFKRALVLVNTSKYEGFGNVFLEAWRYATPVISLHYTLHGVIEQRNAGVHVASLTELAQHVKAICDDAKIRRKLGANGRELVQDEYSLQFVSDRYQQLFLRLVG